ncbi:MAG TPA: helix-hairpin-helix domain-containing protein [Nocardioidaceae bacterium]|nr:helix-hairpin-helix domain-containing protein [Nocardioidaceae bacterium]
MFGRRPPLDSAGVAAAQRRLEALASHFGTASTGERTETRPTIDRPLSPGPQAEQAEITSPTTAQPAAGPSSSVTASPGRGRRLAVTPRHRAPAGRGEVGRWGLSVHHVAVGALVVAVLTVGAAWWVLRSVPHEESVPVSRQLPGGAAPHSTGPAGGEPPASAISPGAMAAGAPGPAGRRTGKAVPPLVVDVAGKVRRPGIVELSPGSRVIDAIEAVGGVRRGVDITGINLARRLVDGEQIVVGVAVPAVPPGPAPAGGSATPQRLDLNAATESELETLPGVGPVLAAAILQWRAEHTRFTSTDELLEVSGIGEKTLAQLEPFVYV